MQAKLAETAAEYRTDSDLLFFTIQLELGLREGASEWQTKPDEPIEAAYRLIQSGANRGEILDRLRSAVEATPGPRGRARQRENRSGTGGSAPTRSDLQRRVGLVVRRLRESSGLTQSRLASACAITQAAVSQIEGGKRINNINSLDRISHALGLSLGRLIELANLEDFEREELLPEALESLAEVERTDAVPLETVMNRPGRK